MRRVLPGGALVGCAWLATACGEKQSTLAPRSRPAREITDLWWAMMIGAWVVFGVVTMLLVLAVLRRRRGGGPLPVREPADRGSKRLIVLGGLVVPALALSALFAAGLRTLPATSAPKKGSEALTVRVTGHQWFWEARYVGTNAVTANEIHIPARTPVRLEVRTADVIHSFWVPELNRKIDTIPGRTNAILLRADEPGVFRGQCAEYCGLQHANMAFTVFADPPGRFRTWLANEAAPARTPASKSERSGLEVFLGRGCASCHTIRGTPADGDAGPDLTHVAARSTLAALTIPNNRGQLAAWILEPQHAKPGNKMPALDLTGRELQSLLDYLTALR